MIPAWSLSGSIFQKARAFVTKGELAALSSVPVIALAKILSFWPVGGRKELCKEHLI